MKGLWAPIPSTSQSHYSASMTKALVRKVIEVLFEGWDKMYVRT